MSSLKSYEKMIFEEIFNMPTGYVLDFNEDRFASLFREHHININLEKYLYSGTSKAKRLRAFWELENDITVGKLLKDLLECARVQGEIKKENEAQNIINRLFGLKQEPKLSEEDQFLKKEFEKINLSFIKDPFLIQILNDRLIEIEITIKNNAFLSSIFLMGSVLEGVLFELAYSNPALFNTAKSSPKRQGEKSAKPFSEWTLNNLIDVSHEIGIIREDVKRYIQSLRDFRNFIHPREQILLKFTPDKHTVEISFKVLQASISQINQYIKNKNL